MLAPDPAPCRALGCQEKCLDPLSLWTTTRAGSCPPWGEGTRGLIQLAAKSRGRRQHREYLFLERGVVAVPFFLFATICKPLPILGLFRLFGRAPGTRTGHDARLKQSILFVLEFSPPETFLRRLRRPCRGVSIATGAWAPTASRGSSRSWTTRRPTRSTPS